MTKEIIFTEKAPKPIGPYSQAIKVGPFLFGSGQIPIDPLTGQVTNGGIKEQTKRVMENIKALIEAAGYSMENIVKVTVFIKDLKYFNEFNEVYAKYFKEPPARTTVQVAELPRRVLLEIDFIAYKE